MEAPKYANEPQQGSFPGFARGPVPGLPVDSQHAEADDSATSYPNDLARYWRRLIANALKQGARTPFYVFASDPIRDRLLELESHDFGRPIRQWLSFKTQPLRSVLNWWKSQNRPVEVVSEYELRAAINEGFAPTSILVNGPAKHRWLPAISVPGLRVNFDSHQELSEMLPLARLHRWQVGLRITTPDELDLQNPENSSQFGFEPSLAISTLRDLAKLGVKVETLHFHTRTNINDPDIYDRSLRAVVDVCRLADFRPRYLDVGGGLPPRLTRAPRATTDFHSKDLVQTYANRIREALNSLPSVEEVWTENGRFVFAGSGALALSILDVKTRGPVRQFICDGGRTLNAMISAWESHSIIPHLPKPGPLKSTVVFGPTCMAFDQLGTHQLPDSVQIRDVLIWLEAGAYHLPWETRFSHGLSEIWWQDGETLEKVRDREPFERYWNGPSVQGH